MEEPRIIDFFGKALIENDAQILKDFYKNNNFLTKRRNKNLEKTIQSLFKRKCLIEKENRIAAFLMQGETIEKFPEEISYLTQLNNLSLRANKIYELPKEIYNLRNLLFLSLGMNALGEIPKGISKLKNLTYLDLEECYLKTFPKEITKLEKLEKLHLEHNNPYGNKFLIPPEIGNMKSLEELNLYETKLKSISKNILKLENLTELDIRHENMNYKIIPVVDLLEEKGVKVHYKF